MYPTLYYTKEKTITIVRICTKFTNTQLSTKLYTVRIGEMLSSCNHSGRWVIRPSTTGTAGVISRFSRAKAREPRCHGRPDTVTGFDLVSSHEQSDDESINETSFQFCLCVFDMCSCDQELVVLLAVAVLTRDFN